MRYRIAQVQDTSCGSVRDGSISLGPLKESPLSRQAAQLLTSVESRNVFARTLNSGGKACLPHIEVGAKEGQAEQPGCDGAKLAERRSPNTDQVAQALEHNANAELFDALLEKDRAQAADFAVRHQELHTHALHDAGDEAFRQEIRMRLTGDPRP